MNESHQSFLDSVSPNLVSLQQSLRWPGLTADYRQIKPLLHLIKKTAAVWLFRQNLPAYWLVFIGGTGTGKSTLFNAFCGTSISATGVERPKTHGPILFAHEQAALGRLLGAETIPAARSATDTESQSRGCSGRLTVVEHNRDSWDRLIVVDTPDLDSVALENRQAAEDLYLMADAVVFVTSQEKYADEVPYEFLLRILEDRAPLFFILNKSQPRFDQSELLEPLRAHGRAPAPERVWLIPFAPDHPEQWVTRHPAWQSFVQAFFAQAGPERIPELHQARQAERAVALRDRIEQLQALLDREIEAANQWLDQLQQVHRESTRELLNEEEKNFASESRQYLQAEIRKLFSRYDVLAKPRRVVREILLAPLRLFGFGAPNPAREGHHALRKARDKIDLTPVQNAVAAFNRAVLEALSPEDKESPLFREIRQAQVALTDSEVKERVWQEQERLVEWLEDTFQDLSAGISKGKEWGIYSTSVAWGVLILAFETTIGGGFTVVDAALDSALAPFVTKGAVELFAYNEIQRVARALAERYQNALISVLTEQKDRYIESLQSLLPPAATLQTLAELKQSVKRVG